MTLAEIMAVGKLAGEVLSKVLDKLPDHDQKIMERYFKLLDTYYTEMHREDKDHDYLLDLRERYKLLNETVIKEMYDKNKK